MPRRKETADIQISAENFISRGGVTKRRPPLDRAAGEKATYKLAQKVAKKTVKPSAPKQTTKKTAYQAKNAKKTEKATETAKATEKTKTPSKKAEKKKTATEPNTAPKKTKAAKKEFPSKKAKTDSPEAIVVPTPEGINSDEVKKALAKFDAGVLKRLESTTELTIAKCCTLIKDWKGVKFEVHVYSTSEWDTEAYDWVDGDLGELSETIQHVTSVEASEDLDEFEELLEDNGIGTFERVAEILRYWFGARVWPVASSTLSAKRAYISIHDDPQMYDLIKKKVVDCN